MDAVLDWLVGLSGLTGGELMATLAIVSLVARLVGKAIPDDKTGWQGGVRNVAKILGLYVSNRITTQVSVTDVSKVLLDSKLPIRDSDGKFTTENIETAARKI